MNEEGIWRNGPQLPIHSGQLQYFEQFCTNIFAYSPCLTPLCQRVISQGANLEGTFTLRSPQCFPQIWEAPLPPGSAQCSLPHFPTPSPPPFFFFGIMKSEYLQKSLFFSLFFERRREEECLVNMDQGSDYKNANYFS